MEKTLSQPHLGLENHLKSKNPYTLAVVVVVILLLVSGGFAYYTAHQRKQTEKLLSELYDWEKKYLVTPAVPSNPEVHSETGKGGETILTEWENFWQQKGSRYPSEAQINGLNMVRHLRAQKFWESGIKAANLILAIYPRHEITPYLYLELAVMYSDQGNHQESFNSYQKVVSALEGKTPFIPLPWIWFEMGRIAYQLKQFDQAQTHFEKFMKDALTNPTDPNSPPLDLFTDPYLMAKAMMREIKVHLEKTGK